MPVHNPNLPLLLHVATRLEALQEELVYVGGCATALLLTDPAASPVRSTNDVDVIVEVAGLRDYSALTDRLRALGCQEDQSDGAPICRWKIGHAILDVMPTAAGILGFSNRWYGDAITTAERIALTPNVSIPVVTAPYFVATKLEAFHGRGRNDHLFSHDLEDIVSVLDGRPELAHEVAGAEPDLRAYLANEFAQLLATPDFIDALPGFLSPDEASQRRLPILKQRALSIARLL